MDLPVADSKVTISSRNLHNDEIDFKVKFNNVPSESRKSKLKKVAIPILTFILLKVITLVPLGLGILGIKAFNALQLSFFSFVISVGLAVFQLCRKVSSIFTGLGNIMNFNYEYILKCVCISFAALWPPTPNHCYSWSMGTHQKLQCSSRQWTSSRHRLQCIFVNY